MDTLSRYSIKKKISSGGMATIFLAEDSVLKRLVAIKKVHPHLLERPETIKRFNNEAKIAASLSHDNIVTIFDYGESNGEHYIIMEFIDGCTLTEIVERHGPLPNLIFLDILTQILSGLGSAHERGICHRDVKPENILLDKNGIVHITDFGIAHLINEESITLTGAFVGSPGYVSPEQVTNKHVTEKSDMFSLGSLSYVCVTGNLPFPADNPSGVLHKVINEEPVPPLQQNSALIQWVSDYILKCLQKDPQNRPNTQESLAFIKMLCINDNLSLQRDRYGLYVKDPPAYNSQEKRELFDTYKNSAYANFRAKKYIAALKSLNQASSFGVLSKEEVRMKSRIVYRGRVNAVLISILIILTVISGLFFAYKRLYTPETGIKASPEVKPAVIAALKPAEQQIVTAKPDTTVKSIIDSANQRKKNIKPVPKTITSAFKNIDTAIVMPKTDGYGYLDLRTNPPWVKVLIDDITIGETPKTGIIPLKTGQHTVALEKAGFKNMDFLIDITTHDTVTNRVKMEPITPDVEQ